MNNNLKHMLNDVWESYPNRFSNKNDNLDESAIIKIITQTFALGPQYYYTFNFSDNKLRMISNELKKIHGLKENPNYLHEIIDLIHPDDISYVIEAEKTTIEIINEIGFEHHLNLKPSYCFRMKIAEGTYQLFHHQAIQLMNDDFGHLAISLNIHTNISHITSQNNKIVLIQGIGSRKDFIQKDLSGNTNFQVTPILTKREKEILKYVAEGKTSQFIAQKLYISVETVRVHRKNILKKTDTHSSGNLIKKCLQLGII